MVGFDGICYSCSMNELVSASQERTRLRTSQFRGGLRAVLRSGLDVVLPPLCPVPLHWRRLWGRRFNRSARSPVRFPANAVFRCCMIR
jgi:hypothetical protein